MNVLRWLVFALGIVLVLGNWLSVIRTLVAPRGFYSRVFSFFTTAWRNAFLFLARRLPDYRAKDRLLSLQEPTLVLALLAIWLTIFLTGFAFIIWPLSHVTIARAFEIAGSSEFTLGFATPTGPAPMAVVFMTAATGVVVIALQVGFLPTLYNGYNRRETLLTLLESRAGSPAWGPEILSRHANVGLMENLAEFYEQWEKWSADVGESHTTYPSLLYFRSPKPLASWITGLLAVLDSAALLLAFSPDLSPIQARLCLRMGFTAMRDIAQVLRFQFEEDPLPTNEILLTYEDFVKGVERMRQGGFP
ncbi:MAG: hypothetical protein HKL80_11275, partial [Acidimicrobiales bacterium]|nr:hypothetical protein [Acidimicrobiales bacterium]